MGTEGMRASLPSRDWIADSVELVVHAERMDGLLTIAGCDKTLPAMMLAMIRLDLPSVFAYGGSIRPGCFRGQDVTIQDVYEGIGAHATGKMSLEDLTELECVALPGAGSCASMYTANTMASVARGARALRARHGLAARNRPGAGRSRAPRGSRARRRARERPPSFGRPERRPRSRTRSPSPPRAAARRTRACTSRRSPARPGIEFGLADIDRISRRTPQIAEMRPAGRFMMQDLDAEGGVPVVMRELLDAGLLDGDAMTVTGRTIAEELAGVERSSDPQTPVLRIGRRAGEADRRLRRPLGQPRARRRRDQGGEPDRQPPPRAGQGLQRRAGRVPARSRTGASSPATSSSSATRARRAGPGCRR